MENIKKMRIGKRITAWVIFLMMCMTLLPTNVAAVGTGDTITVSVYGPCGYLGQKTLTAGMYIQVPCYIESLSTWLRGTQYSNYTYSNVRVTFSPPAYFPSSLEHREGATPDLSKNRSSYTMTYHVDNWSAPHTHSYSWVVTTQPTCHSTGINSYKCSCGNVSQTQSIPMVSHTWGAWQTNPSNSSQEIRWCNYNYHSETRAVSNNVTLTYHANGGSDAPGAVTKVSGSEFIIKNKGSMTRSGYKFLGWSANRNATKADIYDGDTIRINESMTLYAIWEKSVEPNANVTFTKTFSGLENYEYPENYEILWNIVCGSYTYSNSYTLDNAESVEEKEDGTIVVTWNLPYYYNTGNTNTVTVTEKNAGVTGYDYTLSGSVASVNVTGKNAATFNLASMFSGGTRGIVNKYVPVKKVTLTYDANGGENAPVPVTVGMGTEVQVAYGKDISSMTSSMSGYDFLGWSEDKNAKAATYQVSPTGGDKITIDADKTLYAIWEKIEPEVKYVDTPFSIDLAFCYLENGKADIPANFALEMEITNENVQGFKITKTLTKAEASETTNGRHPTLLWELNEKMPQSFENANHLDAVQGSAALNGLNTVKIKAVNGEVEGYQFTMRSGGSDPTEARKGAQVKELTFMQAGSILEHQHSFFNTYVIPYKATHYYYDSVEKYNEGKEVNGTKTVESDGGSIYHFETGTAAWSNIKGKYPSYGDKAYVLVSEPESFKVTQATKEFAFKYVRAVTVTWLKEDGTTAKEETIPNGGDYSELYPNDSSTTGDWSEPETDGDGNVTIKWTEPTPTTYTVTYKDGAAGIVFEDQLYTVEENGATPGFVGEKTRADYVFAGWDKEIAAAVTEDVVYTAT